MTPQLDTATATLTRSPLDRDGVSTGNPPELNDRQHAILMGLAHDWPEKRIARRLDISDRQVRREISRMCDSFRATGRVQLVAKGFHLGVLPRTVLERT